MLYLMQIYCINQKPLKLVCKNVIEIAFIDKSFSQWYTDMSKKSKHRKRIVM